MTGRVEPLRLRYPKRTPHDDTLALRALAHRIAVVATALMSMAALAASWAGYQASVWNGEQAMHGGRAMALRTSSIRASTRAGQQTVVDVQLFSNWLEAYSRRDSVVAQFYERRFRPEFVPAFRAWTASRPLRSPNAAPTPFALPEYRLAEDAKAQRLALAADRASDASQHANSVGDGYVLCAIMFSGVMVFAGAAQRHSQWRLQLLLAITALLLCTAGIYLLAKSPLA